MERLGTGSAICTPALPLFTRLSSRAPPCSVSVCFAAAQPVMLARSLVHARHAPSNLACTFVTCPFPPPAHAQRVASVRALFLGPRCESSCGLSRRPAPSSTRPVCATRRPSALSWCPWRRWRVCHPERRRPGEGYVSSKSIGRLRPSSMSQSKERTTRRGVEGQSVIGTEDLPITVAPLTQFVRRLLLTTYSSASQLLAFLLSFIL